jgi:predicted membrane channel-forming protein YqfA (hemolysin III family)
MKKILGVIRKMINRIKNWFKAVYDRLADAMLAAIIFEIAMAQSNKSKFAADTKGSGEMEKIIGLAISLLIAASIMPVTLTNLAGVDTTDWDPTAKTLWPLLSIFGVLAIVLIFLKYVTKK